MMSDHSILANICYRLPLSSVSRASDTASLDEINLEEKELFQSGKKLVRNPITYPI